MQLSSRRHLKQLMGVYQAHPYRDGIKIVFLLGMSLLASFYPEYGGMPIPERRALFILLLSASMWMTEALPAFAVGFLVIGLSIFLLSPERGGEIPWQTFTNTWSSPIIWLFLGGLILARAAEKTGVNKRVSSMLLSKLGDSHSLLLFGIMFLSFIFSNFMSNTATAAMMLGLMGPVLANFAKADRRKKAYIMAVPLGANIGGMGSIIGTPPNAVAAALLGERGEAVDFLTWMWYGMPPAIVCLFVLWFYLRTTYDCKGKNETKFDFEQVPINKTSAYVIAVFLLTVILWCTGSLHGIPASVVAFVPIVLLPLNGVIEADDMRQLPWDVLILLAGGLTLGVAVETSGLAHTLVEAMPSVGDNMFVLVIMMAIMACIVSNFMSNTAAANIIMPIAAAMAVGHEKPMLVAIALASSTAMCMPVSTPPNALASSSGLLKASDFLITGIIAAIVGVTSSLIWIRFILW
ncbi:SLC13 family permease [Lentisphaera profundi]|uniref:SLC13 family permease n=1 Tax=Lentisphaera profundi TaxID=1658616 RepID=A0ABY7VTF3_9BACT|nr:SLC13 family permease [Lentisphaera profundi]WDE96039.1 SLC13 family permease [Lentisphaera profundi]